jgi:hypothetical protein
MVKYLKLFIFFIMKIYSQNEKSLAIWSYGGIKCQLCTTNKNSFSLSILKAEETGEKGMDIASFPGNAKRRMQKRGKS